MGKLPNMPRYVHIANEYRDPVNTLFPIDDSFSPVLHRVNAAIRSRAIHPNDPIPPPARILTQFSQPPEHLLRNAERHLKRLIEVADVKKGTQQFPPIHKA
jgi:ATP-dependent DNA helicase 2 subunit 2